MMQRAFNVLLKNLDPFVRFEDQTKYFVDTSSTEYYGNSMGALIKSLEDSGTISSGIQADDVIWAAPMYFEMLEYKEKADALFTQAEGASLSSDKQALIEDAQMHYGWYNFLDAYRLATAALN